MIVNPRGELKMSAVLFDFVRPYFDTCENEEEMRKQLNFGIIAWNIALQKGSERQAMLEDCASKFPSEMRADFFVVMEPLIRRKDELFAQIQRPILSYELTFRPSGEPYMTVVSGLTQRSENDSREPANSVG